jgi:putative FmdB family regulatory protein
MSREERHSDMPLYEYECTQCQRHTEKIQKFSDPEITLCPDCGGLLERVVSAPAISFKGGGWFADGYGNAKPGAAKNEGKSDGGSSSGSSSETAGSAKDSSTAPAAASSAPSSAASAAPAASGSEKK